MEITTSPSCRVGWQGQTLQYAVRAEGATELLLPENGMEGVEVRIASQRVVDGAVVADLEVDVLDSKAF